MRIERQIKTENSKLLKRPDVLLRLDLERVLTRFRNGIHRSIAGGLGIELKSFKPYDPSDPLRSIDEFVSARVSEDPEIEPVSRVYYPEKEIATIILFDVGDSMKIPPRKEEYAIKLFWLFAISTFHNGDRLRIIPFDENSVYDSFWMSNEGTMEQFIENIEILSGSFSRVSGTVDAFSYLTQLLLHDAIVVIISDFCIKGKTRISSFKQLGFREHNIRLILIALDEWKGFAPHRYVITVYDPLTHRMEVTSMGRHKDMARRADMACRHLSDIARSVRSLGAMLVSIPLLSDPLETISRAFLKMGWK